MKFHTGEWNAECYSRNKRANIIPKTEKQTNPKPSSPRHEPDEIRDLTLKIAYGRSLRRNRVILLRVLAMAMPGRIPVARTGTMPAIPRVVTATTGGMPNRRTSIRR